MATSPAGRTSHPSLYVSIVSTNRATLDGLQDYFGQAGVPSHCTGTVTELAFVAPARANAAVIFPDDFADTDVIDLVRRLRRSRPQFVALLVTRRPQRFASVLQADGRSVPPIVLPTSSFGWEILDAIRAHCPSATKGGPGTGV